MSKRFTDTEIWAEDWFIVLPLKYKLFWKYLCEKCDCAGIWRPNIITANTIYKFDINLKAALEHLNADKDRIVVIENGRWMIKGFIQFQYGSTLSEACSAHRGVIKCLVMNNIDPSPYVTVTKGLDKGYVTLKDKDKDSLKEGEVWRGRFDDFWAHYPKKTGKGAAEKSWVKMKPPLDKAIAAVEALKKTDQWLREGGQYIPYPTTWLNQKRWEDEVESKDTWKGVVI